MLDVDDFDGANYSAQSAALSAKSKADSALTDVGMLQKRVEKLALSCQALWELLRDKHGFTEDELKTRTMEVDLRDGVLDGRIALSTKDCPKCGSKTNSKRPTCVVCGAPLSQPHAFEV